MSGHTVTDSGDWDVDSLGAILLLTTPSVYFLPYSVSVEKPRSLTCSIPCGLDFADSGAKCTSARFSVLVLGIPCKPAVGPEAGWGSGPFPPPNPVSFHQRLLMSAGLSL